VNSYKAHITSGISDVCPECGVAPHSVEHLFNCQSHPTQLTVQDLWECGTTRLRLQTSSTWTTDDRRRAAGLSQQQQLAIQRLRVRMPITAAEVFWWGRHWLTTS